MAEDALASPQAKRGARAIPTPRALPVPVEERGAWWQCDGVLCGQAVIVSHKESAARLFAEGCFGKGTLSRSRPVHASAEGETHKAVRADRKSQRQARASSKRVRADAQPAGETSATAPSFSAPGLSLLPAGHVPCGEVLQLFAEEAFFLAHWLGCLRVRGAGLERAMTTEELWAVFLAARPSFPFTYAAYHHFRTKGWVPRSGIKFGVDFVLYDKGPDFCHSSYGVIVRPVDQSGHARGGGDGSLVHLSWQALGNANRVGEQIAKDVLIAHVIVPSIADEALANPNCVASMSVCEVVLRRWQPQRTR